MALQGFADGAAGWCTASPNVSAQFALNLYRCAMSGDSEGAQAWFAKQIDLLDFLIEQACRDPSLRACNSRACRRDGCARRCPRWALSMNQRFLESLKAWRS